ncbi:conserved protein of unknown function [Streptococcus sanguinis]|uniref:Uncharacterized protein n=1 Tax=Streptococcus sanguinis TaxID=1305 RepID=A0A0B7GI72_STRSA|nr:conserved protein of unknown function [Streptococcus sanguinis]
MPQQLFKEFAQLDQVEAIVLGGSRAGQHFEENIHAYFKKLYTEPAEAIKLINQLVTTIKEAIPQEIIGDF